MAKSINIHQHDMSDFTGCRQKFDLAFNKNIYPKVMSKHINIGGLFARATYHLHRGKSLEWCQAQIALLEDKLALTATNQQLIDDLEIEKTTLICMLSGYDELWMAEDNRGIKIVPECEISVPIGRFRYVMTLDGKIQSPVKRDGNYILEIKTAAQLQANLVKTLPTNFQIKSYSWGLIQWTHRPVIGILYRFIRKPTISKKKTETHDSFLKRLHNDYHERQDFYFYQEQFLLDQSILVDFEKELMQKFKDLEECYRTNRWYKNENQCVSRYGDCRYMTYCCNPTSETLDTFYKIGEN